MIRTFFCAAVLVFAVTGGIGRAAEAPGGLLLTLKVAGVEAVETTSGVMLQIKEGESASPLLPSGAVSAEWRGFVNADLRGDYRFKAAARGVVTVEINGKVVLDGTGSGPGFVGPSEEVRLNKGGNPLKVTFQGPAEGDAFLRLLWSEQGFLWEPIDPVYLTRGFEAPGLATSEQVLKGRGLFLNRRCVKCHSTATEGALPELQMDAPGFAGIGSRRNAGWMARWIADPRAERADARMPKLLHGETSGEDAASIAAYLATLTDGSVGFSGESKEDGARLIEDLHCVGCHTLPGEDASVDKISLEHLNLKFPEGRLASFLLKPTEHFHWRRMPDFKLTGPEALAIARQLRSGASAKVDAALTGDIARGGKLVRSLGCLNCHALPGSESELKALELTALRNYSAGCLSETEKAPRFGFSAEETSALKAFLASDRKSLKRHVPTEFASRQAREFNCRSCHGELEGFPAFDGLGGKLKPEYMTRLIAGAVPDKPRPWLVGVMPKFPAIAEGMGVGLARSHGYPGVTPQESAPDAELAKIGRRLVGVDGGFSCISCHGVGDLQPSQVFEAEGVNLALAARRLQKDFFIRWLLNPLKIEPQTKMPVYFDEEGNSPLYDVLDGKAMRQLEAFWQYLRAGEAIQPPNVPGF